MSRQRLLTIYKMYALWAEEFDFACSKGCSTCCTQSVSMTMLEGELIHEHIRSERPELLNIMDKLPASFINPMTTNQFAAVCLREEEDGDTQDSWNLTPCVFLQNNCCSIYPVRSFMCRSFGSRVSCERNGEAEVEPLFITLNTVILQCIEHLDQGRPWGNMNTMLQMLKNQSSGEPDLHMENLRLSSPIPGFLIPPDEADAIHPRLRSLLDIIDRP